MTETYPLPPPFSDDEVVQSLRPHSEAPSGGESRGRRQGLWAACGVAAVVALGLGLGAVSFIGGEPAQPERAVAALDPDRAPARPGLPTVAPVTTAATSDPATAGASDRAASVAAPSAATRVDAATPTSPVAPEAAPYAPAPSVSASVPAEDQPATPGPSRAEPMRRLAAEEIRTHLERGEALLAHGDLAAARLFFERVAEAGDARGALGLARSHDPVVVARLPVYGIAVDAVEADRWRSLAAAMAPAFAERR